MKTNPNHKIKYVMQESILERIFKLRENKTNIKTEVFAGITAFFTISYILAANPNILSAAGLPKEQLFTAVCLSAGFATILMGLYAKIPVALASSIGLSAYFTFSLCIDGKMNWTSAFTVVFVAGIMFIIISLTKVKEVVINSIPRTLKTAVTAGIGLFITFIGLSSSGIIASSKTTLLTLGNLSDPRAIFTLIGVMIAGVLTCKRMKGAIVWGVLSSTVIAWGFTLGVGVEYGAESLGIHVPSRLFGFSGIENIALKLNFSIANSFTGLWTFICTVIIFLFVDFFSTVEIFENKGLKTKIDNKNSKKEKSLKFHLPKDTSLVGAIGTTFGALMGTSTVAAYIEGCIDENEGGKTGLTAIVIGLLFLTAIAFAPIFLAVPSSAVAVAMIMSGLFMMQKIAEIDFKEYTDSIPAFFTIVLMPLTCSIANGLIFGTLTYVVINIIARKFKRISPLMYSLSVIFVIKLVIS